MQDYLRFPLEAKLEATLYGMGFELGDRIYREHIPTMAKMDDTISEKTVQDVLHNVENAQGLSEDETLVKRCLALGDLSHLSDPQEEIFFREWTGGYKLPLFYRNTNNQIFKLRYSIISFSVDEEPIEPQISSLVLNDTNRIEYIEISYNHLEKNTNLRLLSMDISTEENTQKIGSNLTLKGIEIEWNYFAHFCIQNKLEFEERSKKVKQTEQTLRSGQLHPYEAYRLVANLIKP